MLQIYDICCLILLNKFILFTYNHVEHGLTLNPIFLMWFVEIIDITFFCCERLGEINLKLRI